jgi:hypothetical protein
MTECCKECGKKLGWLDKHGGLDKGYCLECAGKAKHCPICGREHADFPHRKANVPAPSEKT